MLTLTGPGGVGKTRLALQAASELQPDFADGLIFVPLDTLTDPALVIPTLARATGARTRASATSSRLFCHTPGEGLLKMDLSRPACPLLSSIKLILAGIISLPRSHYPTSTLC